MATYTLSGHGIQPLTSGTVGLHVDITTLPALTSTGSADPVNHKNCGLFRLGDSSGYYGLTIPIIGTQLVEVPAGYVNLGYSVFGSGVVQVVETF